MTLDYSLIGKRIARRRKQLGLKQSEVEERAGIGDKYLSNIERAISIPSTEVIMRLAIALETTPQTSFWWAPSATPRRAGRTWPNCCAP